MFRGSFEFHYRNDICPDLHCFCTTASFRAQAGSVAQSMLSRSIKVTSEPMARLEAVCDINRNLQRRGYPKQFVHGTYRQMKHTRQRVDGISERSTYITTPYIKSVPEHIWWALAQVTLKAAFKLQPILRNLLSHPKDKTPSDQHGIIYKVSCQQHLAVYIGKPREGQNPE